MSFNAPSSPPPSYLHLTLFFSLPASPSPFPEPSIRASLVRGLARPRPLIAFAASQPTHPKPPPALPLDPSPARPPAMFEQYDAEPAFSYYPPPSSASSLALRNRPTASPFEGVSSSSSAPSPSMSSPAAWGGHEQLASSSESFSFASFSGLAEQLFNGGADDDSLDCSTQAVGEGDLASSAFALPRKESASHPMTAGLSAFSSSTTTTQTSYDSYESSSAGGDGGSWGAGSPSPFFPPVDLPSAHDAYSYGTGAVSETFYDDAFGFPSASTSYTVRPSSSSVPEIADLPEWYPDSLSSATLSTKSSFDSFAPASSPPSSANDRWDYYDFENDQPAVEGAWGFGVAPRIAEASGGSSDEEEGSGLEQWVVPNQLVKPCRQYLLLSSSISLTIFFVLFLAYPPSASPIRQASSLVSLGLVIQFDCHPRRSNRRWPSSAR